MAERARGDVPARRPLTSSVPPISVAIDGRSGFEQALLAAIGLCRDVGARELWLCDTDFAHWPLGRADVVAALDGWIGARRHLKLLAADYAPFGERFARWMAWRRPWAHAVQCLEVEPESAGGVPCLLLAPGVIGVHLLDAEHCRGRASNAPGELVRWHGLVEPLAQRAQEAMPVTTLGL